MCVGSPTAGTWSNSRRRPDDEFETDKQLRASLSAKRTGACRSSRAHVLAQQSQSSCALISRNVDADPAAQPSTIQELRRKRRSRKNRYLLRSREQAQPRAGDAVDRAADRDNFRDNQDESGFP
jgi:hypothetical protein